jgi:hypothetical protein
VQLEFGLLATAALTGSEVQKSPALSDVWLEGSLSQKLREASILICSHRGKQNLPNSGVLKFLMFLNADLFLFH